MCDQNGGCEPRNYYDFTENDQFENAQNCMNCEEPQQSCPPQCMECCAPPCEPVECFSQQDNKQFYSQQANQQCFSQQEQQQCYQPCYPSEGCPPDCFDPCEPNPQQRSSCPSVFEACGPCIPRTACPPRYDPCMPTCQPNCDPCCDPCEPLGPCPMPGEAPREQRCPKPCSPVCVPYSHRRYIQPARRESYKPVVNYQRPCIPMTGDTVYKKSFDFIDAQTAASCRVPPVMPTGQLRQACGQFSKETVTKLSFQPYCRVERARPVYPTSNSLLGRGPMQGLTTQKHDFVPKFQFQRTKLIPKDNIHKPCGCVERSTVQRLSFMKPDMCNYSKSESCKPIISYKPPELPMEFETTQKLSFMPNCPPKREEYPWARKPKYCPPTVKFAKETINKLSFQPPGCFVEDNCCPEFCCEPQVKCEMPRAGC